MGSCTRKILFYKLHPVKDGELFQSTNTKYFNTFRFPKKKADKNQRIRKATSFEALYAFSFTNGSECLNEETISIDEVLMSTIWKHSNKTITTIICDVRFSVF